MPILLISYLIFYKLTDQSQIPGPLHQIGKTNDGSTSSSKKRKLHLIFHFVNIFYIYIMIIKEEEKNKSTFQFPKDLHFFLERIFFFPIIPPLLAISLSYVTS